MKLFVEMDDEQYEKYKHLLKDELISKEIGVINFLEATNFRLVNRVQSYDITSSRNVEQKNYEKGNVEVIVKVWGR